MQLQLCNHHNHHIKIDATINICTEEIWPSSGGTTFFSRDFYDFQGAFRGAGAQQSVIGKRKALAYSKEH